MTSTSESIIAQIESLAKQAATSPASSARLGYECIEPDADQWAWNLALELTGREIERSASTLAGLSDDSLEIGESVEPTERHGRIARLLECLAARVRAQPPSTDWTSPIYGSINVFGEHPADGVGVAAETWRWELEVVYPGQGAFIGADSDLLALIVAAFVRYGISATDVVS